jgi:hypothetical protein
MSWNQAQTKRLLNNLKMHYIVDTPYVSRTVLMNKIFQSFPSIYLRLIYTHTWNIGPIVAHLSWPHGSSGGHTCTSVLYEIVYIVEIYLGAFRMDFTMHGLIQRISGGEADKGWCKRMLWFPSMRQTIRHAFSFLVSFKLKKKASSTSKL